MEKTVTYYSLAGIFAGFSLSSSLRRYVPSKFSDFSPKTIMVSLSIPLATMMCGYCLSLETALKDAENFRKSKLFEKD
jgi:O-antigen/teichoic acid export membrane protein